MPASQNAFDIAKEGIISQMRTSRTTGMDVLWSYVNDRDMGLKENRSRKIFEEIRNLTLEDVKAIQEKWVRGRTYTYGILGDARDIDIDYLKTLGEVRYLTAEEIFGY